MSIVKALFPNRVPASVRHNSTERFFGEVVSYDIESTPKSVTVKHTETGELRQVVLNADAKFQVKEGYERPDIDKFARRGKSQTAIGGTLLIENAFRDKESGQWKARWISGAIHNPNDGRVATYEQARVTPLLKTDTGKQYRILEVLDTEVTAVRSKEALRAAVTAAVTGRGNAFVRFGSADGGVVGGYMIAGGNPANSVSDRVATALAKASYVKLEAAMDQIGEQDVVEVVPATRVMFGADSATADRLDRLFVDGEEGGRQRSKGFTAVLVSIHIREDGSEYVTSALPKSFDAVFTPAGSAPLGANASAQQGVANAPLLIDDEPDLDDIDLGSLSVGEVPVASSSRGMSM